MEKFPRDRSDRNEALVTGAARGGGELARAGQSMRETEDVD
jgi:hypothetical protein